MTTGAATTLLDDEHVRIEHWQRGGEGTALVVTFDPLLYLWTRPPFGHEFLGKQGLDVVAVRKKEENFYQPLARTAFEAALAPLASRYPRVVVYGSSLGAYAALYFGRDLPWTVIASSPRVSAHPVYGTEVWQQRCEFLHEPFKPDVPARCNAVIFFDPRDAIDRRYLQGEVLPQFRSAEVVRVPFAGHPANQFLGDIGYIAPYVRAVIADTERPTLQRRTHRARSATYHQVLALLCVQHGHVAWADALVQRALALNPKRMLAHRTLGLVRLAQQRWDEAQNAIEAALTFDPYDPYSIALHAKARARGMAPVPAPAPPGLLSRVWRGLRRRAGGLRQRS
ncbi:MAG TPA: tetratricopeptide repeat protein [Burkholderiaceae bacterium]